MEVALPRRKTRNWKPEVQGGSHQRVGGELRWEHGLGVLPLVCVLPSPLVTLAACLTPSLPLPHHLLPPITWWALRINWVGFNPLQNPWELLACSRYSTHAHDWVLSSKVNGSAFAHPISLSRPVTHPGAIVFFLMNSSKLRRRQTGELSQIIPQTLAETKELFNPAPVPS